MRVWYKDNLTKKQTAKRSNNPSRDNRYDRRKEAEQEGGGHIKKVWHEDLEEEYLERQRKEQKEDEKQRKDIYNVAEQYIIEKGFESDGKIHVRKMKERGKEKSIPLPKALKEHYNIQ